MGDLELLVEVIKAAREGGGCRVTRARSGYVVEGEWVDDGAAAVIFAEHLAAESGLVLERVGVDARGGGRVEVTLLVRRPSQVVLFLRRS